ncbi:MAG: hypothetical protein NT157_02505 [Candidatus Micrarchaeota archaeon]|nr:hypothetical protein [Candidatus Micrarchaeota archaeon]
MRELAFAKHVPGRIRDFFSLPLLAERIQVFFDRKKIKRLEHRAERLQRLAKESISWTYSLTRLKFDKPTVLKAIGMLERENKIRLELASLFKRIGDSVGEKRQTERIKEIGRLIGGLETRMDLESRRSIKGVLPFRGPGEPGSGNGGLAC